jgi:hypothetical protein
MSTLGMTALLITYHIDPSVCMPSHGVIMGCRHIFTSQWVGSEHKPNLNLKGRGPCCWTYLQVRSGLDQQSVASGGGGGPNVAVTDSD